MKTALLIASNVLLMVDATLTMARKVCPGVKRETVEKVVRMCHPCESIDPALVGRHVTPGHLYMKDMWDRAGSDICHVGAVKYLTVVDHGPSRYAMWTRLERETEGEVSAGLSEIFARSGPPKQIIFDNSATFRSARVQATCDEWGVPIWYQGTYKPRGNAVAERHHLTIKRMIE